MSSVGLSFGAPPWFTWRHLFFQGSSCLKPVFYVMAIPDKRNESEMKMAHILICRAEVPRGIGCKL
jgi:hypothetical protein